MRASTADRRRRYPAWPGFVVLVLVACVVGATAAAAQSDAATITCSMTITNSDGAVVTSAPSGARLTYTMSVSSSDPTLLEPGTVNFWWSSDGQVGDDTELTVNGDTGTASISTSSLAEGSHDVYGQWFTGLGGPSCTTSTVPITIGGIGGTTTKTSVDDPPPVDRHASVTLTATVTQNGNAEAPVGGNVIFSIVSPVVHLGDPVPLVDNTATLQTPINLPAGSYEVLALYTGDLTDKIPESSGTATLVVVDTSALVYHGDASVQAGMKAALGGTLTDSDGQPIANEPVSLSVVGVPGATCTGTTDANGVASCTTVVDATAGSYTTTADFAGNTFYKASHATGSIAVTPGPTTITYTGDTRAVVGRNATLSATLTTQAGAAIQGAPVHLSVVGHPTMACTTPTSATGVASCTVDTTTTTGDFEVDASYVGDPTHYLPAQDRTAQLTIVVSVPTVLTYVGPTATLPAGSTVAPQFALTDDQGNPVPDGTSVSITFNGVTTIVTTTGGTATAPAQTFPLGGTYPASATFAGAPGYDPHAAVSGSIHIAPAATTLTIAPTAPVLIGQKATLSGTLTTTAGAPLTGKTVTLSFDGVTCSGTTDDAGVATCTTLLPIGGVARDVPTAALFAGDAQAGGSNATGTGIVYAQAPGGGFFVVGDGTAAGHVTFWGAQWAKVNVLSAGGAPDAFKGFAGTTAVPTQCGTTWTTRPGNSTPPPAGPLPRYIGVIVSSSIRKSGAAISGNVVSIVVVRTDGGYASDPGHAGTGTVVASACAPAAH